MAFFLALVSGSAVVAGLGLGLPLAARGRKRKLEQRKLFAEQLGENCEIRLREVRQLQAAVRQAPGCAASSASKSRRSSGRPARRFISHRCSSEQTDTVSPRHSISTASAASVS